MDLSKRSGLGALLVAISLLCCTAPALAADKLTPPPTSPSQQASGLAATKYTLVSSDWEAGDLWLAQTRFTVRNLEPFTDYVFVATDQIWGWNPRPFRTDKYGNAAGRFEWGTYFWDTAAYEVWLMHPDGVNYTVVLESNP